MPIPVVTVPSEPRPVDAIAWFGLPGASAPSRVATRGVAMSFASRFTPALIAMMIFAALVGAVAAWLSRRGDVEPAELESPASITQPRTPSRP